RAPRWRGQRPDAPPVVPDAAASARDPAAGPGGCSAGGRPAAPATSVAPVHAGHADCRGQHECAGPPEGNDRTSLALAGSSPVVSPLPRVAAAPPLGIVRTRPLSRCGSGAAIPAARSSVAIVSLVPPCRPSPVAPAPPPTRK